MELPCVFCDRSQFEERLIGETSSLYFIATLGQITDGGYTLVIPKRHVPCVGAMEEAEIIDVERAVDHTSEAIRQEYGVWPVMFEHGIVGQTIQHAHLHFLPISISLTERISHDFPKTVTRKLSSLRDLHSSYTACPEPYLFWTVPGGGAMVCWNPPAPPQYLRTITAELMGRPERANWRNMDAELDRKLWSDTVRRLKKYF